jgi:hypothetical protein
MLTTEDIIGDFEEGSSTPRVRTADWFDRQDGGIGSIPGLSRR